MHFGVWFRCVQKLATLLEGRNIKVGRATYNQLTEGRKPSVDKSGMMHWPVLFLHPEVMVSDFIEDFFEMDTFGGHLDIISFTIILPCHILASVCTSNGDCCLAIFAISLSWLSIVWRFGFQNPELLFFKIFNSLLSLMKGNAYGEDAPSLLWDTRHEYTRKRVELYYLVCSLSVPQYSDFAHLQLVDYVNCNI